MHSKKNPSTPSFTFKVATFNTCNYIEPPNAFYDFNQIYTYEQWCKKNKWIATYLDKFLPDIIGFQEIFSSESLKKLVLEHGYDYFNVVDEPDITDGFIYKSPVVAIASKFPIVECSHVDINDENRATLGLDKRFSFNRKVLRASIDLPYIGIVDVYVVHLKSKRPMVEHEHTAKLSLEQNIHEQLKLQLLGQWASSIQRGSEATLLQSEMHNRRKEKQYPMILLGDFNDILATSTLDTFNVRGLRYGTFNNTHIKSFLLSDAWDLFVKNSDAHDQLSNIPQRKPTHYYGNKGSVLDYILLSCEFDNEYDQHIFEVTEHTTLDKHIVNPSFDIDGYSTDHGIVQTTLTLSV